MSSPLPRHTFSLNMTDELCLAIRQILVNTESYILDTSFSEDMDKVRQDFYGNGHIAGDSDFHDDCKENRYPKNPLASAAICSTGYLQVKAPGKATTRRPLGARVKTFAANSGSVLNHCVFCQNNDEPAAFYTSHVLRDALGRCQCPILRSYTCPRCGAKGDNAHTLRYCTKKPIVTMEDATSTYKKGLMAHKYRGGVRM